MPEHKGAAIAGPLRAPTGRSAVGLCSQNPPFIRLPGGRQRIAREGPGNGSQPIMIYLRQFGFVTATEGVRQCDLKSKVLLALHRLHCMALGAIIVVLRRNCRRHREYCR